MHIAAAALVMAAHAGYATGNMRSAVSGSFCMVRVRVRVRVVVRVMVMVMVRVMVMVMVMVMVRVMVMVMVMVMVRVMVVESVMVIATTTTTAAVALSDLYCHHGDINPCSPVRGDVLAQIQRIRCMHVVIGRHPAHIVTITLRA